MHEAADITAGVLDRCRSLGFALAGVCDARPSAYGEQYRQWIAEGRHGEMAYLARNVDLRLDPAMLVPGAKSIICVADRYEGRAVSDASQTEQRSVAGRIARYAQGNDYHKVMRKRLTQLARELGEAHPGQTFRACVDTAPVLEREHAQRAGLGAIGKNTLLIQRGVGSWLLLGEIITTLPLTSSRPSEPDPCGTCTRCIDACPTEAISPWSVDATRCISYLTIEHRGPIDERFHAAMGDWLFGCDICQEVCPHNQPTARTQSAQTHPSYLPRFASLDVSEVMLWDESDRASRLAGSAMKRAYLGMLKRNASIAMNNRDRTPVRSADTDTAAR